ncbi:MAG: MFS transporter [Candidatus Berkiella sp.]
MRQKTLWFAVLVSALGYFVDVYDIILFSNVRIPSLRSLGLSEDEITSVGLQLINMQLIGMLLGGLTFGMLGDKRGRLSVLFGSIFLYSSATLANAFVTNVEQYAILRFIAGFGLAGELGGGLTLVNELMSKEKRGLGTMIIAVSGMCGGICGGLVSHFMTWKTAYIVGGLGGYLLLLLRVSVKESPLFVSMKQQGHIKQGNPLLILKNRQLLTQYLQCLLVGAPFWVFVGLFMAFAPEVGKAMNVITPVTTGLAFVFFNVGLGLGDLLSSLLSQWLKSRRQAVMWFVSLSFVCVAVFLTLNEPSDTLFYFFCAAIGFSTGHWAVFLMMATELFGTNLRTTVSASLPNFVRAMAIPFSFLLATIKPTVGILGGLGIISLTSLVLAFTAAYFLGETYAKRLDFVEQ